MTPKTYALWWCKDRKLDLETLKTDKHFSNAAQLNALICDMRDAHYRFWEISNIVDRTNEYCKAVYVYKKAA